MPSEVTADPGDSKDGGPKEEPVHVNVLEINPPVQKKRRIVYPKPKIIAVPPGKVGLTVEFLPNRGAFIKEIHPTCPVKDLVQQGDYIVTIDGRKFSKPEDLIAGRDRVRQMGIIPQKYTENLGLSGAASREVQKDGTQNGTAAVKRKWGETESTSKGLSKAELVQEQAKIENEQKAHMKALSDGWEYRCKQLLRYKRHLKKDINLVPLDYKAPDDMTLGEWVKEQRRLYKLGKLDRDRVNWLLKQGFDFTYVEPSLNTPTPTKVEKSDGAKEQVSEKKLQKSNNRTGAAKLLAPRLFAGDNKNMNVDNLTWKPTEKKVNNSTTCLDVKDLRAMILTISRANPDRAVRAISVFLKDKSNDCIKTEVGKLFKTKEKKDSDEGVIEQHIVAGIKASIAHHTKSNGGSRTIVAETFIKNVVFACLFGIVKEKIYTISDYKLSRVIGTSGHQVSNAREQVQEVLDNNGTISSFTRATRKDCIRVKLEPYIFDFLQYGDCTGPDPRNKGPVEVVDPRTGEKIAVPRRIWVQEQRTKQHQSFLSSEYYHAFQRDHNNATVGRAVWNDVLSKVGKFVFKPPWTKPDIGERVPGEEQMFID